MKQKFLFFFLTAFLSLIGGGELWADDITVTSSAFLSDTQGSPTVTNCTLAFYGDEGSQPSDVPAGAASGTYYYSKINDNKNFYVLTGYKSFAAGDVVTVYLYANGGTVAYKIGKTAQTEVTQSVTSGSVYELPHTLEENEIESDGTLRIYRNSSNTFFAGVSVTHTFTPVSDNTVQTYPYTWDFSNNTNDQWTQSLKDLSLYTIPSETLWQHSTSNGADEYRPKVDQTDWQYDITLLKGLKFSTASVGGSPCLDYKNQQLWVADGTVITIPEVKAGQIVKITGTVTVSSTSNLTTKTASSEYTVTSNGDVTLTFNSSWIKTLAVLKTAITRFNFKGGGANTTTYDYDSNNPTFSPVLIIAPSGAASNKSLFTVTNSTDTEVIAIANSGCSSTSTDNINFGNSLQRKKPGTSTVTFSFAGNDAYEPATFTATYTINKLTPTVTFTTGTDQTKAYSTGGTYTDVATASNEKPVTYTSSNTNVATVSDAGVVTFVNSGVTKITASVEGDEYYNAASASYTLTVNGSTTPTLTWTYDSNFPNLSGTTLAYGNNAYCFATATGTTATVQYKSSNTKIATVAVEAHGDQTNACKITPTGNGEVTITAYVEGSGNVNPAEVSFTMTIEGQEVHMSFQPTSGTVKVGKTITPYISVPDIKMADITSVTVTTSDASKATVTAGETTETLTTYTLTKANGGLTSYTKDDTEYLEHIYATIKGETVTSGAVTITVTVNSDIYKPTTATYQVTVNDNDLNFNWEAPSQTYTLYTGDYMMIPAITGNANGNWSYSKGSTCESEQAYLYDIKSGTPTWNNRDFKIGEGIPDYRLYDSDGTTVTDKAYIVWVNGQSVHTDVLMIYAKSAGTVKLHAKDPQTGASPVDITINIINKSTLTSATTSYVNNMSFPYTWSFVGESSIATVSPNYWEDKGDYYTCGMSTAFNFDYCDEDNDGNTGEALKGKYFVDENGIMPQFYGMTVEFGNSGGSTHSYKAKEDKLRLYKYDSDKPDQPLLLVVGGTHKIALPAPGAGCPSNYKLFVKARSRKTPAKDAILQAYWSDSKKPYYSFTNNDPIIFSVDVTSGDPVKELWVSDVDIYWIAMSTEAKDVARPAANSTLTYAAASYSYPKALDLSKSAEVNSGVTAYYASDYAFDLDAAATNTEGYAVVLTAITSPVPANTGLVLRKNTTDVSTSCYMIADGENELNYVAPSALGTNYLKATSPSGKTVGSNETIDNETYTNFAMAYAYKMYHDPTNPGSVYTDYLFDRDWSFYRIMGDVSISNQKSYLQIPGNLYVDRDGNIVEGAASRRAADDNRPSTKPMLDIIYEDVSSGDSGVTGITSVSDRLIDNDAWYTLQGIRVDAPAKGGIYIHNGRKVVIK